jgi:hypothetical protein
VLLWKEDGDIQPALWTKHPFFSFLYSILIFVHYRSGFLNKLQKLVQFIRALVLNNLDFRTKAGGGSGTASSVVVDPEARLVNWKQGELPRERRGLRAHVCHSPHACLRRTAPNKTCTVQPDLRHAPACIDRSQGRIACCWCNRTEARNVRAVQTDMCVCVRTEETHQTLSRSSAVKRGLI